VTTMIEPGTREALERSLAERVHESRRCFPVVGSVDHPSAWDEVAGHISLLLDRWLEVRDGERG